MSHSLLMWWPKTSEGTASRPERFTSTCYKQMVDTREGDRFVAGSDARARICSGPSKPLHGSAPDVPGHLKLVIRGLPGVADNG
jgi:hypothetical protein